MSDEERMEVKLIGRALGTATGWDGDDTAFCYYDFKPHDGINLPVECDLSIDIQDGRMGAYHPATGDMIDPVDIVEFLVKVPRT